MPRTVDHSLGKSIQMQVAEWISRGLIDTVIATKKNDLAWSNRVK